MRIDISDAEAEQGVSIYEMQHFLFCRDAGLRQVLQGIQNKIALPQVAQGKFTYDEGVGQDCPGIEQLSKGLVAPS